MKIHILYHCNAWQEHSSFRLICVVDDDHLQQALKIIKKKMKYTDEEMNTFIFIELTSLNKLDI